MPQRVVHICLYLLHSSQVGEAAAPHHAHHGLCPAAVPTTRRARHPRPRSTVSKAVMARGSQADECHQHSTGPSHVPQGNDTLILLPTTLVVQAEQSVQRVCVSVCQDLNF